MKQALLGAAAALCIGIAGCSQEATEPELWECWVCGGAHANDPFGSARCAEAGMAIFDDMSRQMDEFQKLLADSTREVTVLTREDLRACYPRYDYDGAVWSEEWQGWLVPVQDGPCDLWDFALLPVLPSTIKLIDKGQTAEPPWPMH